MSAAGGTSALTRAGIAARVGLALLLALAAAAAVTWLAGRPGLRARLDLTASGRNTLDPELAELIRRLPVPVKVEVFFRQEEPPVGPVLAEAQSRFAELLYVAEHQVPGKLEVVHHDLSNLARAQSRMQALDLQEVQTVVVHSGDQRAVLRLLVDIARFDEPGSGLRPRMVGFRGDEALARALLRVTQGSRPKARFLTGHGERDLYGIDERGLGRLQSMLAADGFDTSWWNPLEEPRLPPDTAVLAVIDPMQPYPESLLETIRGYVAGGGRLLVAPSSTSPVVDGRGSIAELLRGYGIQVRAGIVSRPVPNAMGQLVDGEAECGMALVVREGMESNHPVTEALWRVGMKVILPLTRAFHIDPALAPKGAILTPILRTGQGWLDLPGPDRGPGNWRYDRGVEEGEPYFIAGVAATFPPLAGPRQREEGGQVERLSGRVLALGSADAMINALMASNQPLLLNSFNWLTERDWRLTLRPRARETRKLDVESDPRVMRAVTRVGAFGLPGLCALLGVLLAWKRRR